MLKRTCHPYYGKANKRLEKLASDLENQRRLSEAKNVRDTSDNMIRRKRVARLRSGGGVA